MLYRVASLCRWFSADSMRVCVWAAWAFLGYHLLLTLPITLQSAANLVRTFVFLRSNAHTLSQHEFRHILFKELFRVVVVGGGAVFVISAMPRMIWDTGAFVGAAVLATLAFHLIDQAYNLAAQLATRLLYGAKIKYKELRKRRRSGRDATKQLQPPTYNLYK